MPWPAACPLPVVVTGTADIDGGVVFVFPGQGSQWLGMGAELLESSPVFAERLRECAAVLDALTGLVAARVVLRRRRRAVDWTGSTWCSRCCSR